MDSFRFRPGLSRVRPGAVARAVRGAEQQGGVRTPAEPHLVAGRQVAERLVARAALHRDDLLAGLQHRHDLQVMAEHHRRLARRRRALAARVGVDLLGPQADAHALAGAAPRARRGRSRSARPPTARPCASPSRSSVALEVVHVADEVGDERGGRPVVDLRRRGELVDPARVHDGDAVGHRHRLLLVVRDHDEGDADVALDPLELDLHRLAQLEVERAERLVEQQHLRLHDQRAGERHALLHAAGELRGLRLLAPGQAHELERLVGLLVALLLADLALLEAVGDVVEHASGAGTARRPGRPC